MRPLPGAPASPPRAAGCTTGMLMAYDDLLVEEVSNAYAAEFIRGRIR